jgi:hypothetical protein
MTSKNAGLLSMYFVLPLSSQCTLTRYVLIQATKSNNHST